MRNSLFVALVFFFALPGLCDTVLERFMELGLVKLRNEQVLTMDALEEKLAVASGFRQVTEVDINPDDYRLFQDFYHKNRQDMNIMFTEQEISDLDVFFDDSEEVTEKKPKTPALGANRLGLSGFITIPDSRNRPEGQGSLSAVYRDSDSRWIDGKGWQAHYPVGISLGKAELSLSEIVTHFRTNNIIRNTTGEGIGFKYSPAENCFVSFQGFYPNSELFESEQEYLIGIARSIRRLRAVLAWGYRGNRDLSEIFIPGLRYDVTDWLGVLGEWDDMNREYRIGLRVSGRNNATVSISQSDVTKMKNYQLSWEILFI